MIKAIYIRTARSGPLTSLIMTFIFFMVPRRYKPLFRAVRIALCQSIMTSLAKHFTASYIFSRMLKNLAQTCLLQTLFTVHSNHTGTIGHCDVTIAGGRLLYRWRHNRSTFWIFRSSDGIKCGFTSVKSEESHKWFVHRIHGSRNVRWVLFNERQAPRFQRR